MFEVIPCVDIQSAKAVRLFEGDPTRETVYFDSPLKAAQHWVSLGAKWLHLVDLDAALGTGSNAGIIHEISQTVEAKIEVGGGVRSFDTAKDWLKSVDRVVLGTVAVKQPGVVDELLERYGSDKVVVSVDAKDGLVAVRGWRELSRTKATDLARRVAEQGVTQLIYTDISRDGTLKGVNPDPVAAVRDVFPDMMIAGGGVATDADFDVYESLGLDGAIVGRALYEGTITYPRAT